MSKFVLTLILAFILVGTSANAEIAIVTGSGTSSGRAINATSYEVSLPSGVTDGDLVVVAIASDTRAPLSADGYTTGVEQGFKGGANGCFEFYHVWKTGDSTSPAFSRSTTGSDAYAVVALSGVETGALLEGATGTSSEYGTRVNLPAITTRNNNDMDVYASCAEAGATFSSPTVGTIAVQQANTSGSVAISTYEQATGGLLRTQTTLMDTNLFNGSAVMALIAAPTP